MLHQSLAKFDVPSGINGNDMPDSLERRINPTLMGHLYDKSSLSNKCESRPRFPTDQRCKIVLHGWNAQYREQKFSDLYQSNYHRCIGQGRAAWSRVHCFTSMAPLELSNFKDWRVLLIESCSFEYVRIHPAHTVIKHIQSHDQIAQTKVMYWHKMVNRNKIIMNINIR